MPFHKIGLYDAFHSVEEAKQHYRRCRKMQTFILAKETQAKTTSCCAVCRKPLNGPPPEGGGPGYDSNICEYFPSHKKVALMHYVCAWSMVLDKIMQMDLV